MHLASSLQTGLAQGMGSTTAFMHTHLTVRQPTIETVCPAKARAAIRTRLNIGKRQQLVYTYNTSSDGLLIRYELASQKKTILLDLANATISDTQLSPDGHFIVFVTQVNDRPAIQMVRIDGQNLQTLYCAPNNNGLVNFIDNLLWSPDQQQIVFRVPNVINAKSAPQIQLLNLSTGTLQTLITPAGNTGYIPRSWSTANQIYAQGYAIDDSVPQHDIYVLDVANKSIKRIALIEGYGWDMDLTPDGHMLLLSQGANQPPLGHPQPPSLISEQDATGGVLHVIYASHVHAVTQVRAISATTLLFVLGGRSATGDLDGLWKINTNGSDLTFLTKDGKLLSDRHTLWSSISRDERMYAVMGYSSDAGTDKGQAKIFVGPLNGDATTVIDTIDASNNAEIVGWTMV